MSSWKPPSLARRADWYADKVSGLTDDEKLKWFDNIVKAAFRKGYNMRKADERKTNNMRKTTQPTESCEGAICEGALEAPVRLGRSQYVCRICKRDISLIVALVGLAELQGYSDDS